MTSLEYKENGNKAFKNKNYDEAIEMYTKAIVNINTVKEIYSK